MTDDEKKLGELALRKVELTEQLGTCRDELKELAKKVELPVCIPVNGKSVHVVQPAYHGGMPQCKVYRCVR